MSPIASRNRHTSRSLTFVQTLAQDSRFGLRMLVRRPLFALVSIVTLALGIGATTAVFSVVQAVLLQPLPYPAASQLVILWGHFPQRGEVRTQVSATDVHDWRAQNGVFEDVSTFGNWSASIDDQTEPERIRGAQVGDGYFRILRGTPILGRTFTPDEQIEGKDRVIVLSYGLWKRRFAGDLDIVGKTLELSGRSYTIVGVMSEKFASLPESLVNGPVELYRPVAEPFDETQRSSRHLRAIARLKEGTSLGEAQTAMTAIASRIAADHPVSNPKYEVRVVGLTEEIVGKVRSTLILLLGSVLAVLGIACANIGNLTLARSVERQRELALRAAIGAGRWRLIKQLLTESILLSVTGGLVGILLAVWGLSALDALGGSFIPSLNVIQIDLRVLAFTFAVSLTSGIVFGLAPALQFSRPDLGHGLRGGGRAGTSPSQRRIQNTLLIAEMAMALTLLVSAGLLLKTMRNLHNESPGFETGNLLSMSIYLGQTRYPDAEKQIAFYDEVQRRIEALPGVVSAGYTSVLPLGKNFDQRPFQVETHPVTAGAELSSDSYFVSAGYIEAMQIPLKAGRTFKPTDGMQGDRVAIVNESYATRYWPDGTAVGRRIKLPGSAARPEGWRTIVGVVGNVKQYGVDIDSTTQVYIPQTQFASSTQTLVVRTTSAQPMSMLSAIKGEIQSLDSKQAIFQVASMESLVEGKVASRTFLMRLLGVFALLALVLAATGIYGVVSYSVTQRTREIAVRMALGASVGDVLKLIIGRGLKLSIAGVLAGSAGALIATQFLRGFLFGVGPIDLWTFLSVSALLVAVAALACYLPARRAQKVDPMNALRYD